VKPEFGRAPPRRTYARQPPINAQTPRRCDHVEVAAARTVACTADSGLVVMNTSRRPRDAFLLGGAMLTSWRANTPVTGVQHAGTVEYVELNRYSADVPYDRPHVRPAERADGTVRALDRLTAASITSPSTALAVGDPPAPRP
jgi:hypothetical protein